MSFGIQQAKKSLDYTRNTIRLWYPQFLANVILHLQAFQLKFYSSLLFSYVKDITNSDSFESLKHWYREIDRCASENINKIVVGNKADWERIVP